MQSSPLKSRPTLGTLSPVPRARHHVVAADGAGAGSVARAFAAPDVASRTTLIHARTAGQPDAARLLAGLGMAAQHLMPDTAAAALQLRDVLGSAVMGTYLYLCGSEDFLSRMEVAGLESGMVRSAIQMERSGPLMRRVQCVHCKGFLCGVTVSPITCSHCGVPLLVRDHYSRRLGAYMGVSIDAEAPGDVPPATEFSS